MKVMQLNEQSPPEYDLRFDMTNVDGIKDICICEGFRFATTRTSLAEAHRLVRFTKTYCTLDAKLSWFIFSYIMSRTVARNPREAM